MTTTTNSIAGDYQADSSGNDFLHYRGTGGNLLYAINSNGQPTVVNGITGAGQGTPLLVYASSASYGYAVFNTAAAVNMQPSTVATGLYRYSLYMVVTTSFSTNTEMTITAGWTDADQAQTLTSTTGAKTAGTTLVAQQLLQVVTGAAVTWTPAVTGSNATAGAATVAITLERLI